MFILERFTDLIAPFCCVSCGREGSLVCDRCQEGFCVPVAPRCYRCLKPSPNFAVCSSCRTRSALGHVWMASQLTGMPEELIHQFKFERAQAAALNIACFMSSTLPNLAPTTVVLAIPTATRRIRERGYDHASLLAQAIARQNGYRQFKVLKRVGQTRQVGATRVQRLVQLRGTFRVSGVRSLKNAPVLLVDDVVTTGATLGEAAATLRKAGVRQIDAVVFAQK